MVYAAPTRSEFRAVLLRSLRDPSGTVFSPAVVNDFIDEAMMDLSAYRPNDAIRVIPFTENSWFFDEADFDGVLEIWMVIAREPGMDASKRSLFIPHADYQAQRAGWDFITRNLYLSRHWIGALQNWARREGVPINVYAYGYSERQLPTGDDSVLDFDTPEDQFCVTQHCKMLGFQLLNHDRALYQQWLAATNNTDVSPTQLQGMLSSSESTFDRARRRGTFVRRRPVTNTAVAF